MSPEQAFSILNLLAAIGWLPLIFLPRVHWAAWRAPVVMPAILAAVYTIIVVSTLPWREGSFSSLSGVRTLFADPWILLAGWTHYLAFDLFVGGWEVRDAQRRGIPHAFVVPVLVLTFLVGPAGLLLYLIGRRLAAGKVTSGHGRAVRLE